MSVHSSMSRVREFARASVRRFRAFVQSKRGGAADSSLDASAEAQQAAEEERQRHLERVPDDVARAENEGMVREAGHDGEVSSPNADDVARAENEGMAREAGHDGETTSPSRPA